MPGIGLAAEVRRGRTGIPVPCSFIFPSRHGAADVTRPHADVLNPGSIVTAVAVAVILPAGALRLRSGDGTGAVAPNHPGSIRTRVSVTRLVLIHIAAGDTRGRTEVEVAMV